MTRVRILRCFFLFFLFICWVPRAVWAAPLHIYSSVDSPPYVVRIYFQKKDDLAPLIQKGLDIFEGATDTFVLAQVTQEQYSYLVTNHYSVEKITNFPIGITAFPAYYKTYEQISAEVVAVVTQFPTIAEKVSIGDSWETKQGKADRKIWGVRVGKKNRSAGLELVPKILYVSGHHAREVAAPIVALRFLHLLTDNYGKDAEITWLVDNREIVIIPLLNPDGYIKVEAGNSWRKNTNDTNGNCPDSGAVTTDGVDLNRNYSYQWGSGGGASTDACASQYQGPSSFSEPETQAIRDFITQEKFDFVLSYHSYGRLIMYPWNYTLQATADDSGFRAIASKLSQKNTYTTGQAEAILYKTTGDTNDWVYGTFHIPVLTFEISKGAYPNDPSGFFPTQSEVEDIWNDNKDPMILAAKLADKGFVHGKGPEIKTILLSGSQLKVETVTTVVGVEYFIDTKGADGAGTALSGSGTSFSGTISQSGRFLIVSAQDANGWGPPSIIFLSANTTTPTPTPSAGGPTTTPAHTPSGPTPTSGPTTPASSPTAGADGCPSACSDTNALPRSSGNANCDGSIDEVDYVLWRAQFKAYQAGKTIPKDERTANFSCSLSDPKTQKVTLLDFEIWRSHAFPVSEPTGLPEPTAAISPSIPLSPPVDETPVPSEMIVPCTEPNRCITDRTSGRCPIGYVHIPNQACAQSPNYPGKNVCCGISPSAGVTINPSPSISPEQPEPPDREFPLSN